MKLLNTSMLEIKKSKFIAYYYEVDTVNEIKEILETLKKEHKKAKHIPYAYKIDQEIKKSDDKEPSGTSGMPILNIIETNNLNHVLIAVVRYFGGIKLGAGGLIRAYSNSAKEVIKWFHSKKSVQFQFLGSKRLIILTFWYIILLYERNEYDGN